MWWVICIIVFVLCLGQWLCEVERFDPCTKQWSLIAPMQHSRTGVAVTALRGMSCVYSSVYTGDLAYFRSQTD